MNSSKQLVDVSHEIREYFELISYPHTLLHTFSFPSLLIDAENSSFKGFWELIERNNLSCYQLVLKIQDHQLSCFYLDLETPLIFIPLIENLIEQETLSLFLLFLKSVRSQLLTIYNQEIEELLINIVEESDDNTFHVFKAEEQQKQELRTIVLKKGRKKKPFGILSEKNKLNTLTGREWLRMTKSWTIVRPPPRKKNEILHPAKFPELLVRKFITFFTKPGELVLDPFLGSGSTVIAAKQSNRNAIGIELSEKYVQISKERLLAIKSLPYSPLYTTRKEGYWHVIQGDSSKISELWTKRKYTKIDFVITSPPYWSQLDRTEMRQKGRKDKGLDTKYSEVNQRDLANITNYDRFLEIQKDIFLQIYDLVKPKGYLMVITNNVFTTGKLFPLAYDTATSISSIGWVLKDEKIWLQDDKRLLALGVNNAWVGNRCHQYCLIFRKE